ncbi:MAG: carbamoyl phosphate synthase small subunit, partial [Oscillospiraceae bacterium]|nr:carbamoyl phosphate synthase small subunit [Oscillospiraceae bacterium]
MTPMGFDRKLVLSDGTEYYGRGFGGTEERVFDLVFNTNLVGYQEVVSDPTYAYKGIVMTYPIIGSCGMADDDFEARLSKLGGLVVRQYNDSPSNFRCTKTLADMLEENGIPGITGVDTRALARRLREQGSMRAVLTPAETEKEEALLTIESAPDEFGAVKAVSCRKRWYSRTANHRFSVAAVDCGIRLSF